MRRVPAALVTGFLGAGKTSLVRHLLAGAAGRRLAVIVNFGRPWQEGEARVTQLVVIGESGLDQAAITAALGL